MPERRDHPDQLDPARPGGPFARPAARTPLLDRLRAEWRPLLADIASGAVQRELDDTLPVEQVHQLKEAGFGALRVPRAYVSSRLFEVAGTRSALDSLNLNRHWRNARTHSLHDPAAWKVQHLGRHVLDGVLPPNHGQL